MSKAAALTAGRRRFAHDHFRLGLGVALAASLLATSPALASPRAAALPAAIPASAWPADGCTTQAGHRFITTTDVGDEGYGETDDYVAEPSSKSLQPVISAATALRHFEKLYRPLTKTEVKHTQVRFGLITEQDMGPASGNAIEFVPELRRVPAWLVTNCVDAPKPPNVPPPPPGFGRTGSGQIVFVLTDTKKANFWDWTTYPHHYRGNNPGIETTNGRTYPANPGSTPYYSTAWKIAVRGPNKVLLKYQPRRCWTLDHVNTDLVEGVDHVSVILYRAPHHGCSRPSATQPYTELFGIRSDHVKRFAHERTGHFTFEAESS